MPLKFSMQRHKITCSLYFSVLCKL